MKSFPYMILVAFMMLSAVTKGLYTNKVQEIASLKAEITSTRSSIGYLETLYTPEPFYPYTWPIHPEDIERYTSGFGLRNIPAGIYTGGSLTREHIGLDLAGVWHSRVCAIADGEVIDNYYPPGEGWNGHPIYGGMIRIRHTDGKISLYAHLSATYINETDKRFVKMGQVIGRTGATGMADGEHLHLEIWDGEKPLQPLKYIGNSALKSPITTVNMIQYTHGGELKSWE